MSVSAWSSRFWVFRRRGVATFVEPALVCRCAVSLVGDFNGDRKPDLVSRDGVYAPARMNRGDGTFTQSMAFDGQGLAAPVEFRESVSSADLNGEGIPDLVFANGRAHGISVYLGNGDGTFRALDSLAAPPEVYAIQIADLNSDGFPDILATVWKRNRGELVGVFGSPIPMRVGYTPSAIGIADLNLDHQLDLAVR